MYSTAEETIGNSWVRYGEVTLSERVVRRNGTAIYSENVFMLWEISTAGTVTLLLETCDLDEARLAYLATVEELGGPKLS